MSCFNDSEYNTEEYRQHLCLILREWHRQEARQIGKCIQGQLLNAKKIPKSRKGERRVSADVGWIEIFKRENSTWELTCDKDLKEVKKHVMTKHLPERGPGAGAGQELWRGRSKWTHWKIQKQMSTVEEEDWRGDGLGVTDSKRSHCCSVAQSCPTLCDHGLPHARLPSPSPSPGACSNSCSLSRGWHPTISSPSPPAFNLSQHQGLF